MSVIFSPNLGSYIPSEDLFSYYLGAEFMGHPETQTIEGVIGDPVGNGLLFLIDIDEERAETITPTGPNTSTSLNYADGGSALIKTEKDQFKTAYFPYDISAFTDVSIRNDIFERLMGWFDVDVYAPVILNKTPADGYKYPINTTNVTLELETDEYAHCRYSDSRVFFEEATAFSSTNSTQHSTLITGLENSNWYTIYLYCMDVKGNTLEDDFTFYIWNRTFYPPIVENITDMYYDENDTIAILVNATDPEEDPLTYLIEDITYFGYVPFAHNFILTNNTFSYHTSYLDAGEYDLRITVSDGFDNVTYDFKLTINNVNQPPSLAYIGPRIMLEDEYFFLDVDASDIDQDDLRYYDDSDLFDIHIFTGEISFNPKDYHIGFYLVNISVTDSVLWDHELVNFTVRNSNDPPTLDFVTPQFGIEGTTFNMTAVATDPENDTLTFSDNTTLFDIDPFTGFINFTPTNADVGTHYILISVTDSSAGDSKVLNLVIEDLNQAPRFLYIPDSIIIVRNNTISLNITACDPDVDPLCT